MSEEKEMETNAAMAFSPIIIGVMRLGVWGSNLSSDDLEKFIDACVEMGLRDFDHADIYGHYTEEQRFGEVLKRRPDLRSEIRITTKCGIRLVTPNRPQHRIKSYDSTKEHIIWSAENSVRELGVDHLDVLLLHRPDYLMDPAEVVEAFEELKQRGLVKDFGVSNFSPSQFELLHAHTPLVTNQVEISLLHRNAFEDGTLDQCMRLGVVPTAWSPFGGGAIFSDSADDPDLKRIRMVLQRLAESYDASMDQILLAWLLKHPAGIIPVLGTSRISRVEIALAALKITLSHEDWYELWEAASGHEVA